MPATPPSTIDGAHRPYDVIRARILESAYPPGTLLREVTLSNELGHSRTPIREALARLEHEELLERTPRGLRVRQFGIDDIVAVYESCLIVEPAATRLAALRRTQRDVLVLQRLLEDAAAVIGAGDPVRLMDDWHIALWDACRNPSLVAVLNRLSAQLFGLPAPPASGDAWGASLAAHREITDAVVAQDAERAETLMRAHLEAGRDAALQALQSAAGA
ncbi:GntR family transcriptional regulator [Microbacterium sp. 18062]|uniref:GntR family transcriptional regulator n=1 Tax=Microbacterium sp. 18062 TaxID=2681410 RepID=UPI00135B030E|nr:GntR family transcriptional regulator [Microbacterium sp. 18062]